ncbi:MAG: hypothetical protein RIC56_05210 [Pseudomonadales bacterium]
MRPGDQYHAVSDSLQADVMRFMAIIAFCLIAILALVRSVEPVGPVQVDAPVERAVPGADPVVASEAPVPAAPQAAPPDPKPEPKPEPVVVARPAPAPQAEEPGPPAQAPAASTAEPARAGLSLRFASDQDFLRLVNRGAIRVFAFNDQGVLALENDFSFQPASAPGRVHELLPETIPELMSGALARSHGGASYRWGIAMPERMARQIRGYVDRGASGELVIDRFGEVRHHGA